MKRKRVNPKITHVMADGKVLSHEEFMAKPYIVVAEDNYDFHVKCNQVFDPNYFAKEQLRRKFEFAEQRKLELQQQQAKIAEQLQSL